MSLHHGVSLEATDRRPTVLLVDDDEVNLLMTAAALRDRGFDITSTTGGEEALTRLASWTPDVVVLDAIMPGLDGFETCIALRNMPGFDNVPVLMLTGLDDEASINRAYQVGATDFFVKATQWSLLAGRLRYLLRASRTRQELERSKAKLARAQDLARMGSFDWWQEEGRSFVNGLELSEEGLRVFGYGPDDRVNLRDMLRMIAPTDREPLVRLARQILYQVSVIATDVPMTLPDGRFRIIHVEAEPEFDEHGHCCAYTGIVQDVTDRRIAEDRIRHLANYDALTNLPNRRQLIWRAERALEFGRRLGHQVALLLIDLDRFKVINDTLGHAAGDELLMEVAFRLRGCVRHCEQLFEGVIETAGSRSHRTLEAVGRLGGDEFVALLPEVADEADAQRVATRILEALREPVVVAGQDCFATASVGIALFPRDGNTVADLLRNSDVAMYAVKSQGRNDALVYTPRLAGRGREKLALESALHKAIERDELVLYYQPKVDVASGKMVGVEALMRWRRGDLLIQPADFIPVAEETGLIVPMSEWLRRFHRREHAQPHVRAHRPDRADLGRRARRRHPAQHDPAGDHRDGPDEGPAARDPVAAPAHRDRRADRRRRLRHRLFVARLPHVAADRRGQDRPQLRARPGRAATESCGCYRDHRAREVARPQGGGRRCRKPTAAGRAVRRGLFADAGFPVQQAAAAGGHPGLDGAGRAAPQGSMDSCELQGADRYR